MIHLVKDNCYSNVFSVKQLQENKIVERKSEFSFRSFIVGRGAAKMKIKLLCHLKVCKIGDQHCQLKIAEKDDHCDRSSNLDFRAITFTN